MGDYIQAPRPRPAGEQTPVCAVRAGGYTLCMILLYIAGGFLLCLAAYVFFKYFAEPANIDKEAAEEAESDSPDEHEHVRFEHEREVAQAMREEIDAGYSGQ